MAKKSQKKSKDELNDELKNLIKDLSKKNLKSSVKKSKLGRVANLIYQIDRNPKNSKKVLKDLNLSAGKIKQAESIVKEAIKVKAESKNAKSFFSESEKALEESKTKKTDNKSKTFSKADNKTQHKSDNKKKDEKSTTKTTVKKKESAKKKKKPTVKKESQKPKEIKRPLNPLSTQENLTKSRFLKDIESIGNTSNDDKKLEVLQKISASMSELTNNNPANVAQMLDRFELSPEEKSQVASVIQASFLNEAGQDEEFKDHYEEMAKESEKVANGAWEKLEKEVGLKPEEKNKSNNNDLDKGKNKTSEQKQGNKTPEKEQESETPNNELEELKDKYKNLDKKLNNFVEKKQDQTNALDAKNKELMDEIGDLKGNIEQLKQQLNADTNKNSEENKKLKAELRELEDKEKAKAKKRNRVANIALKLALFGPLGLLIKKDLINFNKKKKDKEKKDPFKKRFQDAIKVLNGKETIKNNDKEVEKPNNIKNDNGSKLEDMPKRTGPLSKNDMIKNATKMFQSFPKYDANKKQIKNVQEKASEKMGNKQMPMIDAKKMLEELRKKNEIMRQGLEGGNGNG